MRSNIYKPKIYLSDYEKKLLKVIASLIIDDDYKISDNFDNTESVLSDDEATELIKLLTLLLDNPDFKRKAYFVDGLTSSEMVYQSGPYQMFFDGMKRSGRTPAMARAKWQELVSRYRGENSEPTIYKQPDYMSFEHFLRMEKKLFVELGLDPFCLSYLLIKIRSIEPMIESIRSGRSGRSIRIDEDIGWLRESLSKGQRVVSKINLASTFICVANTGVIFTTRDWTLAGGISAIGGAALSIKK